MKAGKITLPALVLGVGLILTGCAGDADSGTRNRTNDTGATSGAMSGTGTQASQEGSKASEDLDRRNRTGTETGMSSGSGSTTGGGTSLSGTAGDKTPHRRDR